VAGGVEWVAPSDASKREPAAAQRPVSVDCFGRVLRAGGSEPANRWGFRGNPL